MIKTRMLLFCFSVLLSLPGYAAGKNMLLKLNGAETVSVSLSKTPQYWLKGGFLFLKTPEEIQQYEVGSVEEIVFKDSGYANAPILSQDEVSIYPTLTTSYVYLKGADSEHVSIVAADGKVMPVRVEKNDEAIQLNVSDFPMGVYQLYYGKKSFKFIKGKVVK